MAACVPQVNTLWGSFEINNTRLAKVMLQQMASCALDKHIDRFDQVRHACIVRNLRMSAIMPIDALEGMY